MKPIPLAVVGCGFLVNNLILPALKAVKEFRIAALLDTEPTVPEKTAKDFGFDCPCFNNLEDLLAIKEDIGAAYICTPNNTHEQIATALLKAGIPVLCEKPLAPSHSAALRMVKVAQKTKVPAMVAYMGKLNVYAAETVRIVKSGELGTLKYLSTAFCYDVHEAIQYTGKSYGWRCRKSGGGGALGDIGVYPVAMLRDMFGPKLKVVSAAVSPLSSEYAPLSAVAELRAGKVPIHLYASITCPKFLCHMEIIGSKGSLTVAHHWTQSPSGVLYLTIGDGLPKRVPLIEHNCYSEEFRYFARVISGKQKIGPAFSFAGGAEDVKVLDAIAKKGGAK